MTLDPTHLTISELRHLLDGREVFVELPVGVRGKARVVIDLTGAQPLVRLVGSGPAPV